MKAIIICNSVTGNTKKIAEAIQAGIRRAGSECDLVRMKDANPRRLYDYDLIGIGSMTLWAEPKNVAEFVQSMRYVGGKHAFAFSTHGASPARFFPSLVPKMTARGMTVIGMRDWFGAVTIYHSPKPYPTDGHPDETDLREAEAYGAEMVDVSRRVSAGETGLIPAVPQMPPSAGQAPDLASPEFTEFLPRFATYDREKCSYPDCRLCMEGCPVDGIDLSVEPPILLNPCIECESCLMVCPTGAIEAKTFTDLYVPGTPMGSVLKNHFLPWLEKEEAAGRFRRHVKLEDIGWETPLSRRMKGKHPQFIVGKGILL